MKEKKEQPTAEELDAIRAVSDRIRSLENQLREENVRIYVSFDAGGILLAWVEEHVSRKWRIMSLVPEQEAARPLQTQPSAIRTRMQPFLDSFEQRLRAQLDESQRMGGPRGAVPAAQPAAQPAPRPAQPRPAQPRPMRRRPAPPRPSGGPRRGGARGPRRPVRRRR
jgi:hypothetical protein